MPQAFVIYIQNLRVNVFCEDYSSHAINRTTNGLQENF